ncbi:MAG: hypothetical protein NTW80_11500 [Deltaproteobacteria bacterium]|nr:hypothetical protein [Deltaproteobacteria bacterium]
MLKLTGNILLCFPCSLSQLFRLPAGKPAPEIESFLELSSRLFGRREEQERLELGTAA